MNAASRKNNNPPPLEGPKRVADTRRDGERGLARGPFRRATRFGIVTPRRTRTRRGVASTRGRERGAFYRASIAPVREIARRRIPRSIARTSRSIRRGIRSRTRAMRRSSARAVGFRDGRRSKKTKKNKKKHRSKETPYRIVRMRASRVRGCIAVVDSLPRGAHPHRCAGSRQVPEGRLEPTKGVRSFVRRNQGMVYGGATSPRTHRDGV